MERSVAYTLSFAAMVAIASSTLVATVAVSLHDRQQTNRLLDRRRQILEAAGLSLPGERLDASEVMRRFAERLRPVVVDLATGAVATDIDPTQLDPRRDAHDPATSRPAPQNDAGVMRMSRHTLVYHLLSPIDEPGRGAIDGLVLPFEGVGLWSKIYGYIALSGDLATVRGITFYEHAETAGLGARISEPEWRARWQGRRLFDDDWQPRLRVTKGIAGTPDAAPFAVDGISGATLTGNGVSAALHFWLGDDGFGPYLARYRAERGIE